MGTQEKERLINTRKEGGLRRKLMGHIFKVARTDGIENTVKPFLGKKE